MAINGFSERLSQFLQVDRKDGHVSFCYPSHSGYLTAHLRYVDTELQSIARAKGKERTAKLKDLTEYVRQIAAREAEIDEEWTAHIDGKKRDRLSVDEPNLSERG